MHLYFYIFHVEQARVQLGVGSNKCDSTIKNNNEFIRDFDDYNFTI